MCYYCLYIPCDPNFSCSKWKSKMEGEENDIDDHNIDDAKEPRGEEEKGEEIHAQGKHYCAHRITGGFVLNSMFSLIMDQLYHQVWLFYRWRIRMGI